MKQKWCDRLIDACNLAPSGTARRNCHSEVGSSSPAQDPGKWMASIHCLMPLALFPVQVKMTNFTSSNLLSMDERFFFQHETLAASKYSHYSQQYVIICRVSEYSVGIEQCSNGIRKIYYIHSMKMYPITQH